MQDSPDRPTREILRTFSAIRRGIAATIVLAVVAAMLEAAALISVVSLTNTIAQGRQRFARSIGPFDVSFTRSELVVLAFATVVASAAVTLYGNEVRSRIAIAWVRARRIQLVRSFAEADWSVQSADRTGHLQAVAEYITSSAGVLSSIIGAGRGLAGVAVLLGTAILVSPVAAIAIVVLGALLFGVLRPLTTRARSLNEVSQRSTRVFLEDLGELSLLARDVRVFGVSERFRERAGASISRLSQAERKVNSVAWAVPAIYQAMALSVVVSILAVASQADTLDLASVGAVALLVLRSVAYGQQFQNAYHGIESGTPSIELMQEALDALAVDRPAYGTVATEHIEAIHLEHVSFTYPDQTPGLRDVSVDLHRGEVVGIVGPSGAGKSTLAQILLGLRLPGAGTATADGVPFADHARESWARTVSLVPQEPHLAEATVRDNIAFFRDGIDDEAVRRAAAAAAIDTTIEALEHGYDTVIGRSNRNLSGGQAQRIGIARALAGDPSVLVLDEPTSALDNQSEAAVQQALAALRGKVLVVIIAHRMTALAQCDRIIVMEGGCITADGTFDEVRASSTFFREALARTAEAG